MLRVALLVAVAAVAAVAAPGGGATLADEEALAAKFAPAVRLVEQRGACEPGEPFEPIDVGLLFGNREVAFRGPWSTNDLVKIGPQATDLEDRFEHHLDFPGDALDPACIYDEWSKRITEGHTPSVYAHVARQEDAPGRLALQYWLFYVFNDFNNKHEGDWEMIQLVFDAATPEQALQQTPVEVGYSAHEGAERASWGDEKLELVDGTHPVTYPAAGSHANKFTPALYLGSSASAGVGCDDTRGPHRELRPRVLTIPSDPAAAREAFPWITFEGRWGERQKAFFNGPTGPNMKTQWTEPIGWSEEWRERSYAVPTGGVFGTGATDFFCVSVAAGSALLTRLLNDPVPMLIATVVILGLLVLLIVRATWTPVAPLRIARRRAWGQVLSSSARMYVHRFPLFIGIGLLAIPVSIVTVLLQVGVVELAGVLGVDTTGESSSVIAYLVFLIGVSLALIGLSLVIAAVTCALVEIDAGRPIQAMAAYRIALRQLRPLIRAIAIFVGTWIALTSTVFLIPVAVWLAVRWSLLVQVSEIEERAALQTLRHSGQLVRGRWLRVASLVGVSASIGLLVGPFLGAVLIILTSAPFALLNIVAGLVYVLALPFVALVTSYVYFDARARYELERTETRGDLPAEYELAT